MSVKLAGDLLKLFELDQNNPVKESLEQMNFTLVKQKLNNIFWVFSSFLIFSELFSLNWTKRWIRNQKYLLKLLVHPKKSLSWYA